MKILRVNFTKNCQSYIKRENEISIFNIPISTIYNIFQML